MGLETVLFQDRNELNTSQKEDVVVGYVDTVRNRLHDFGITTPEMDYPKELDKYLGRKVWTSKINYINNHPELWRVFLRYNTILDVRPYKGDWRVHYNPEIIENTVKDFMNAPAGYAIDFGVTEKGQTKKLLNNKVLKEVISLRIFVLR